MADKEVSDAAKKALDEGEKAKAKSYGEYSMRMKGKPTPTQEENDRAAVGEHIVEHEDDGSGPDPFRNRALEAERPVAHRPSTYTTRGQSSSKSE